MFFITIFPGLSLGPTQASCPGAGGRFPGSKAIGA